MEVSELRKPTQKRAIQKKERILEYGFKLMCEKGLHNTDATQIAKYAGVSTGTVYQYFKDKKDIFLQGLKIYAETLMFPTDCLKDINFNTNNLHDEFKRIINTSINAHKISESAHEEIKSLQHIDKEVSEIFKSLEIKTTEILVESLKANNIKVDNIYERAHLILCWIDNLCHEIIYHKHKNMDYNKMTDIVIDSIINLLH